MYKLIMTKRVEKFLDKTDTAVVKNFYQAIKLISKDPFSRLNLDIRRLKNSPKNHFRLRIRKYRFLYEVKEEEILLYFYDADSRGDIYKK